MTRLIDADALMEILVHRSYSVTDYWNNRDAGMFLYGIEQAVNEQPTVDAVPVRHGMWLPKHHYIAGHEFVSGHICSECGNDALNAEGDEFLTDYCPNCGADMRDE